MEASDVEWVYLVASFLEQVSLSSFLKQVSQAASIKYLKGANVLAIVISFAWLSQLVKHMFQS